MPRSPNLSTGRDCPSINLPGENDFSDFFQYLGVKTARYKGLDSAYRKGILRLP